MKRLGLLTLLVPDSANSGDNNLADHKPSFDMQPAKNVYRLAVQPKVERSSRAPTKKPRQASSPATVRK